MHIDADCVRWNLCYSENRKKTLLTKEFIYLSSWEYLLDHYTVSRPNILTYYVFFWVIPRRLNSKSRRFGTLYRFHLQGHVDEEWLEMGRAVCFIKYVFFWVIPRRLSSKIWRFGTLYRFHLQRQVDEEWLGMGRAVYVLSSMFSFG